EWSSAAQPLWWCWARLSWRTSGPTNGPVCFAAGTVLFFIFCSFLAFHCRAVSRCGKCFAPAAPKLLFTSSQAPLVEKLLVCRPAGCLRSLCRALNFLVRNGKNTITQWIGQPLTYSRKDTQTMARKVTNSKSSEQRRAQAEALQSQITEEVEALAASDAWTEFLNFAQHFHNYSLNNLLLILSQRRDATTV